MSIELLVYKADWDEAVQRITQGDPSFCWDKTDPDLVCENCVLSVAAERQLLSEDDRKLKKRAYFLDSLEVGGVEYTGPRLKYFGNRFDCHLMHGRLAPCVWPVKLELVPL